MLDTALVIHTEPPRAFYRGSRPAGVDLAWPVLESVSGIYSELRVSGGRNTNASISLDNGSGRLTGILANAPLRAEASIRRDGEDIWRGVVTTVSIGPMVEISLEA